MDQDDALVEKYMEQVTHVMDQIESHKLQLESISAQAYSLSVPEHLLNSRVQISFDTEAAFARMLEKAEACAERLKKELELSLALKQQAIDLINRYTVGKGKLYSHSPVSEQYELAGDFRKHVGKEQTPLYKAAPPGLLRRPGKNRSPGRCDLA